MVTMAKTKHFDALKQKVVAYYHAEDSKQPIETIVDVERKIQTNDERDLTD